MLKKRILLNWHRAVSRLIRMGGISSGNKVKIFHDGDQAFLAIYNFISNAKFSIYVETYLLAPDKLGEQIRDALIKAALRGVKVSLLYDHFGSSKLSEAFLAPMKKAHIKVLELIPFGLGVGAAHFCFVIIVKLSLLIKK